LNSEQNPAEFIVVGSGLTGAMAAQTLVEGGVQVLMLDVAYKNETGKKFPTENFLDIRQKMPNQREFLLGKNYEGMPWGAVKTGAQLTPGRKFIAKDIDTWLPTISKTFFPIESLAYGGLGNGWGAGCYIFSEKEFSKMGIEKSLFMQSYQTVGDRIGVSAGLDDALPYTVEGLNNIQPAIKPEEGMQAILDKYKAKKEKLNKRGFYAGIPGLAMLTKDKDNRKEFSYNDMDFWHDNEESVYRPWMTVDKLKAKPNFQLEEKILAIKFEETGNLVKVICRHVETNEEKIFWCNKLVLCSGVLGTARIVLRSFNIDQKLPLICNPYVYVPMVNYSRLGKVQPRYKSGMGQMVLFYDKKQDNSDVAMAAMFTYRQLLLFRLIKEAPVNFAAGRQVMQYLVPSMVIAGIHHPEYGGGNKFIELKADSNSPTGDILHTEYILNDAEQKEVLATESKFFKTFFSLGCIPLQKVYPGHGSSIHYGGTLPFSDKEELYSTAKNGLLNQTKNVWVADGSSFKYIPAKGISFTLMANANRVAKHALNNNS
jgi:hypothetical protein